ncbi:MAG: glycosyltransferase [Desulfurobacteriaceae bacterium]
MLKKVLFLLGKANIGGIERMVIDLFKYMNKYKKTLGIDPYFVIFCEEGVLLKELKGEKNLYFLYSGKNRKIKTISVDFYFKLRKLIKEIKPNILHFHSYPVDFIGVISSLGLKVKRIAHIHNFHFIGGKKRIRKYRFISKYIDGFIYVSKAVMENVDPLYNAYCSRREVLYNFIVPERIENLLRQESISRKEIGIPEKATIFCFVGRLTDNKNILNLIKAMSYLKDKKDLYLLLVGGGKLEEKAKNLAKELKLANIIFIGPTSNPFKYLKISDVFVLPSIIEGLGIAHLEAMYLGLPSLISENVPSKEIAYDASLISGTSPESIAKGMEILYKHKDMRDTLGAKAKEIVKEFFIDKYLQRLYEIYMDL